MKESNYESNYDDESLKVLGQKIWNPLEQNVKSETSLNK